MSAKIAAQGRGTRKGIEAKEGPMIHGMLCTLMISTVLPEPEPGKYWLKVELVEWDVAGELCPPSQDLSRATGRVLGSKFLELADNSSSRTTSISGSDVWIEHERRSPSGLFAFNLSAFYSSAEEDGEAQSSGLAVRVSLRSRWARTSAKSRIAWETAFSPS